MLLCFTLSMPNVASWNGNWTGKDKLYARVKNWGRSKKAIEKAKEILKAGTFSYCFGDGWTASIEVREVDLAEARRFRSKSDGFCGYDWMIEEIMRFGRIRTMEERENE